MKYWIACISKAHIEIGMQHGFIQVCHGKAAPLKRMKKDDRVVVYSSKLNMDDRDKYQKFTAIGQILDDNIYQVTMSESFIPFRRDVQYWQSQDCDIISLISQLDFIQNKARWGYPFRYGLFEITEKDFALIEQNMLGKGF